MKSTRQRQRRKNAAVQVVSPPFSSSSITTANTQDQQQQQQQTSIHHFFAKKPKKRIRANNTATVVQQHQQTAAAAAAAPLQQQKPHQQQQKQQRLQQRYLDLGQASFGKRTICHICGMLTVHGLAEDDKEHAKICLDYVHGVPFCMSTTTNNNNNTTTTLFQQQQQQAAAAAARVVLTLSANAKIIEIRPSDSRSLWNKLLQVRTIVDQELGFVQSNSSSSTSSTSRKENCRLTTFLYIHQKRVVGLLSVERIHNNNTAVYILLDNNCERSTTPYYPRRDSKNRNIINNNTALLGIHTIWVHAKFRNQGIAACLVDTARQKMWYGMHNVAIDEIAFSSPTAVGAAFARAYVKANNDDNNYDHVLVYDCYSSV